MSMETDKLEREVESRRSSVESTIDALRNRMSVGQIFDEVQGYMKEGQVTELTQNLGRQVRDNPLALGLVGAGIAWLMLGQGARDAGRKAYERYEGDDEPAPYPGYASVAGRRYGSTEALPYRGGGSGPSDRTGSDGPGIADQARDAASGVGDRLSEAASGVRDTLSSGAASASSGLSSAADSVRDTASQLGDGARAYGHDAYDQARWAGGEAQRLGRRARRTFLDTLQEEPLVVGAVALAIGAAIGASLPSTEVEDEYLGDARDRLRDQAYDYGKDAVESARHVAEETLRSAGEEADAKGLTPSGDGETLAEKVSGVVRTAAGTATSEAKKEGLV